MAARVLALALGAAALAQARITTRVNATGAIDTFLISDCPSCT